MPSKSKRKGDTEERSIVNMLRELGFNAQRTLEAGARSDGSSTYDIDIYLDEQDPCTATLIGECKLRANGFNQIYTFLGDNDFLSIRKDRQKRLFVVNEELFLDYLQMKKETLNAI